MNRVAVVAPLRPGRAADARLLIEQGPPFDPAAAGFEQHVVYVTDEEVVFVFEAPDAQDAVDRLLGEVAVWQAGLAWREVLGGKPRLAEQAYVWRHAPRPPLHVPGL